MTTWAANLNLLKMLKTISASLKDSFKLIWKNKSLAVLLLILQLIFFAIFISINLKYQTKILESSVAIADYMSKLELDDISIASDILEKRNVLGDDPSSISKNYNEIAKNFKLYMAYIFILLIIFLSISWTITLKSIYKINLKLAIHNLFKIFIVLLFYLGSIFLFFFSLFNVSFSQIASESAFLTKYYVFFVFSMILAYFMFVSLALLHKTELKDIVQKTLAIGIRKAHYILSAYFINIFLFGSSVVLFSYFIEKNFFVLFLSIVLIILSFVFGRIFMIKVVDNLTKN